MCGLDTKERQHNLFVIVITTNPLFSDACSYTMDVPRDPDLAVLESLDYWTHLCDRILEEVWRSVILCLMNTCLVVSVVGGAALVATRNLRMS